MQGKSQKPICGKRCPISVPKLQRRRVSIKKAATATFASVAAHTPEFDP